MLSTQTTIRHAVARNLRVQQQHLKQVRQANKPVLNKLTVTAKK